jgi:hypothetical protein
MRPREFVGTQATCLGVASQMIARHCFTVIAKIVENRRFEFRMVTPIYDDGFHKVGTEAALDERCADALDVLHSVVKGDFGAADEKLRVTFWRYAANAVLEHSLTVASKLVFENTSFLDLTWFSRFDVTFSKRRGFLEMT